MGYPFRYTISRKAVTLFWVIVLGLLVVMALFEPAIFYRVTQSAYQRTPFVNTPNPGP